MSLDKDIELVTNQESVLLFQSFDQAAAFELGQLAIRIANTNNQSVTVSVRISGSPVFVQAMPGTAPANYYWANRKANLTELYGQSSYRLGLSGKQSGKDVVLEAGLDPQEYASHGGCFPIRLTNQVLIGSVTVSGLPQREDHILVSDAVSKYLGIPIEQLT